jgi:hypothetical protein
VFFISVSIERGALFRERRRGGAELLSMLERAKGVVAAAKLSQGPRAA